MSAVTGINTGGSTILSYALEWDEGTGGSSFTPLIGDSSDNLVLIYTKSSLTAGTYYMFKYRVRNLFGWSSYSNIFSTIAATRPDSPSLPSTTNIGTSVMI
jgi:hypothetical protein